MAIKLAYDCQHEKHMIHLASNYREGSEWTSPVKYVLAAFGISDIKKV